jgi:hypothetical protein
MLDGGAKAVLAAGVHALAPNPAELLVQLVRIAARQLGYGCDSQETEVVLSGRPDASQIAEFPHAVSVY